MRLWIKTFFVQATHRTISRKSFLVQELPSKRHFAHGIRDLFEGFGELGITPDGRGTKQPSPLRRGVQEGSI